jgi:elongation factor Ts
MSTVTAQLVKELREKSGAGMVDCKTALVETNGDVEAAIDWLRKKGLAKAAKKSSRIAAEGLIGLASGPNAAAVVEVNSETDFVARNAQFQELVRDISTLALKADGELSKLLASTYPGKAISTEDHVKELIATIGENMSVRRTAKLSVKSGVVASYIHNQVVPGAGKIGVLVALESEGKDKDALGELGRMVAMHVAAVSPVALDLASVPADVIAREKAILADKNQGKPEAVLEKIFASAMKSYAKDNCLIDQVWVHDGAKSVSQAIKEHEGKVGGPIKLAAFVRYALGEGIDKKTDDFAAEVAKTMQGASKS